MSPAVLGRLDLHPLTAAIIHCLWGKAEYPHSCTQTSATTDLQGAQIYKGKVSSKMQWLKKHVSTQGQGQLQCVYTHVLSIHSLCKIIWLHLAHSEGKAKSLICSSRICHRPRVCIKIADLAQRMCSDLLDCSTLECACEPRVSYKHVTGNQCLTYTGLIQNAVIFVFWHFSIVFKAHKTQWDVWKHFSKLGVVIKDQPITLYMVSVMDIQLLTSIYCTISIGIKSDQGYRCTELLSSAPTWNEANCPGHLYHGSTHEDVELLPLWWDIVRTNPAPDLH